MKTYRIEVVPGEAEPYHLYEQDEPTSCLCFSRLFTPSFTYDSKYKLANEAEEFIK
jgi:hypothetical protein